MREEDTGCEPRQQTWEMREERRCGGGGGVTCSVSISLRNSDIDSRRMALALGSSFVSIACSAASSIFCSHGWRSASSTRMRILWSGSSSKRINPFAPVLTCSNVSSWNLSSWPQMSRTCSASSCTNKREGYGIKGVNRACDKRPLFVT